MVSDMVDDKIVIPHFATESEEADWWFENREAHDEIMARAMDENRTSNLQELLKKRGLEMPRVSVKFDYEDVEMARKQAAARGVEVDSYVRDLLHEALMKNGTVG
jgi:predicted DNA binding CopG/RHH family protein